MKFPNGNRPSPKVTRSSSSAWRCAGRPTIPSCGTAASRSLPRLSLTSRGRRQRHGRRAGRRHGTPGPRGAAGKKARARTARARPWARAATGSGSCSTRPRPHLALGDPGRTRSVNSRGSWSCTRRAPRRGNQTCRPGTPTSASSSITTSRSIPRRSSDPDNDPAALRNFRTPRFDLDSLYGTGPLDQPFLYDSDAGSVRGRKRLRGVKLLVGSNTEGGVTVADLPRNHQNRALVGDPRNDENIIVSQLQLLFIHFHNRVVDRVLGQDGTLSSTTPSPGAANGALALPVDRRARLPAEGRRHGHGGLRASTPASAARAPTVHLQFFKWKTRPFMPVEFSGAAYRFGHSMVRDNYVLNDGPARSPSSGLPAAVRTRLGGRSSAAGACPPRSRSTGNLLHDAPTLPGTVAC